MVGNYSMNIDLDRNDLKVGEAVTLTLTLRATALRERSLIRSSPTSPISARCPRTDLKKTVEGRESHHGQDDEDFPVPEGAGQIHHPRYRLQLVPTRVRPLSGSFPRSVDGERRERRQHPPRESAAGRRPRGRAQKEDIETLGATSATFIP